MPREIENHLVKREVMAVVVLGEGEGGVGWEECVFLTRIKQTFS